MDKVSEYLKAARISKGVTIEEVAEATLLSPSIIKDIENGRFDRFSGDELYVKMYIRKIARYLEIDESIADDYYIKTREIKLAEIQQMEEKKEAEVGSTTFVDKMSESFKNIQGTTTAPKKPKRVYEDHYIKRYIKYAIVGILIIAIIVVIGYSFIFTRSDDSSFKNTDNTTVEGTVPAKKDEKSDETDKKEDDDKNKDDEKDNTASKVVEFTKNADGDFTFKLPEGYKEDTFKLKVDFTFATTVDLHVNGDANSYQTDTFKKGVYSRNLANISASDALKEDSACESVELEFNVNDFQYLEFSFSWNLGHRYYINDQKIPLEDSDHQGTRSNGKTRTFKLTMVK